MTVTVKVRGARETSAALRDLAKYVSVPLTATSRFALQPLLTAARRNVRALDLEDSTGALAASLTIKYKKSPKLGPVHLVGPASLAMRDGRRPVKYAHLLEFGTAPRSKPGRGSTHPGAAPKPWLTPAYYSTRDEVVKRFGERYGPEMEKRAAKLNKKKVTS